MTLFSFRALALSWGALSGATAVGAAALQASYVPPPAPVSSPSVSGALAAPSATSLAAPAPVAMPFENRSLLAVLPPASEIHSRPAPRPAPVAEPLPVPPVPPPSVTRYAKAEPRRVTPAPRSYAVEEPSYAPAYQPRWDWARGVPYPGQYADSRPYYYGAQPSYYGWQPQY